MKFDKWTFVIIFGVISFISLFLSFEGDYFDGPFLVVSLIFFILTLISFLYPKTE